MVILLGEEGGRGPGLVGKAQVPLEWRVAVEIPERREELCGREQVLVPTQPLVLITEFVALEWKQVCKVAREGLSGKPVDPRLFL